MDHQDWITIGINNVEKLSDKYEALKKEQSNKAFDPEVTRLEAPKQLGQLISHSRNAKKKTQKVLASEIGISAQVLGRWESNKEIPNNSQIAQIEKNLGVKLPRCKKVREPKFPLTVSSQKN